MIKHLITIEFRYKGISKGEWDSEHKSKTITLGVYDTIEEAILEGNKALEIFEKHFKLNTHWNVKDRFSKNGGCFGNSKTLITNLAYLQTPFEFYAKITKLDYLDVEETITNVLDSIKEYKNYE